MKFDRAGFVDRMVSRFGRERWNEHVKLLASTMSAVGAASLIGGFVAPLVNPIPPNPLAIPFLLASGVVLHVAAQVILRYYRSKE